MASRTPAKKHEALLEVEGLVKAFKGRRVVDGVSFEVRAGEIVGLLGSNGAGKTTTFRMTVGLETPDRGKIWLDGKDCTKLPMYVRARTGMGYLPQEASIFRGMTVRDNVLAVLEAMPYSRKERNQRADELLDELDILWLADSKSDTLSGGERRRLEISRALATEPAALLLDEPFAGVAPIAVQEIQAIIDQLRERDIGILITDHNVRETLQSTDRAYIIHQGVIIKEGKPDELVADPKVREVYLGHSFDKPIQGVTAEEEMGLADDPEFIDFDEELETIEE
ncbi:MAG: lipopolysaccharide export system ATP-binding protein [Planctomycetota bacterium]|jgi:lipopolysaccharide export system ATP-binding protein